MKLSNVLSKLRETLATIQNINPRFDRLHEKIEEIKINQGLILSTLNVNKKSKKLKDYEYKIFSQWGEDGIIQHLTQVLNIEHKTFIEFGVEDFSESNCRFLLMKDNWKGFVIDGSKNNVQRLKNAYFYWKYHIVAVAEFITKENIDEILAKSGFDEDLGLLSIDIDGNDYYVLEAISIFKPRILICEYNAVFGPERKISVPYQPDFRRTEKHHSNLYFGASLGAMTHMANKKGYTLVGTNSSGANAFFVRNDLLSEELEAQTAEQAYFPSNFRESRNEQGLLTHVSGEERLALIRGMPVFNVETSTTEEL